MQDHIEDLFLKKRQWNLFRHDTNYVDRDLNKMSSDRMAITIEPLDLMIERKIGDEIFECSLVLTRTENFSKEKLGRW